MFKCMVDYYYKEVQYNDGEKKLKAIDCDKCPIKESCKSQHKEEINVR